jgi:DtxR family Mn-dependent transcriptional regulator
MTPDPYLALGIFLGMILMILGFTRLKKSDLFVSREDRMRTLVEDILKQLYHVEYSGHTASLNGLSGALGLKHRMLLDVVNEMVERRLIKVENDRLKLTDDGRDYALKIIRVHRLWEKYLSEKTGIDKSEWHNRAERMEHRLSTPQTEALSDELGNPRYDPHGDPIPTQTGEMIDTDWMPLPSFPAGSVLRIIHLEDEPESIYNKILKMGLKRGQICEVLENNDDMVKFLSEGLTYEISPVIGSNINVEELTDMEVQESHGVRLSSLKSGEKARILGLSSECRGVNRRRLLDLGFIKDSMVEIGLPGPLREPQAYLIRNTMIALRNDQADLILIEKISNP